MAIDFFKMLFIGGRWGNMPLVILTCISLASVFVGFIVCVVLTLVKRGYSILKRVWFAFLGVSSMLFQIIPCLIYENFQTLLLVGSAFFFCVAILSALPERKIIVTDSQRSFINKLDNSLSTQNAISPQSLPFKSENLVDKVGETSQTLLEKSPPTSFVKEFFKDKEKEPAPTKATDIDFSHVKKIISRLKEMEISPSDKKQIFELESNINQAEYIEYTPVIKSKINSGLGAVLKIMSKYGV